MGLLAVGTQPITARPGARGVASPKSTWRPAWRLQWPGEIRATEILVLHDAEGERSLAIVFFDNEVDYARGDAALNAMRASDTPGSRTSVTRYDVAVRMAA
jgi:hypothetical protein